MVSSIDDRLNQIIRELIGNGITLEQAVEAFEGKYIVAAMSASRGNVTQASKALGVHRNTLHNKLRTQTMLNGFAESIRPARRRISAKRVSAPRSKDGRSGRSSGNCCVTFGYPSGRWGVAPRRPVHEVSFHNQWGQPLPFSIPQPLWP